MERIPRTIAELLEKLNKIENKDQLFLGDVWIADDFIADVTQEQMEEMQSDLAYDLSDMFNEIENKFEEEEGE